MTYNPPKSAPPSGPSAGAETPVEALKRPSGLKKWASELVGIVKEQEAGLFDGWTFGPGALTRHDFGRILRKISGCGSVVELRAALNRGTGEMGAPVVHAANFCGQHTICPYCAGRVQDRRGARFRESIETMARTYPHAYMVTATIPPVPTWREDLDRLISGWQVFRKMGQVRKRKKKDGTIVIKRSGGEWAKIRAGLAKIEIKRGAGSGLPHCHYHALIFTDAPLDYRVWSREEKQKPKEDRIPLYKIPSAEDPRGWVPGSKISAEWFKATGGATNFRVDPIGYREEDKRAGRSWPESVFDQSREVLKYATKFDSHPGKGAEKLFAADFIGIRDATYNRRLFVTYGDFRQVGGNDFEGGGPHLSSGPAIFEARWRGVEYSPLIPRTRPVFENSDMTPAVRERLRVLNRAQGSIRRMRSAAVKSKRHYFETGELLPAFYVKLEEQEDGSFEKMNMVLELPAHVVADPDNPETWEKWVDALMEAGRTYYAQVKDALAVDSHLRQVGTPEERRAVLDLQNRAWFASEEYAAEVVRLFQETILSSRPGPDVRAPSSAPP